jgi:hypothetical protein
MFDSAEPDRRDRPVGIVADLLQREMNDDGLGPGIPRYEAVRVARLIVAALANQTS